MTMADCRISANPQSSIRNPMSPQSAIRNPQSVRILIADDHELVRQGLRKVLESRPDWRVCGEAADGRTAVKMARELKPDVVVMDLSMPELNGLGATREIRKTCPATQVVILTMHEAEGLVKDVLEAGATGYLLKTDASRMLVAAIEAAKRGEPFFSGRVASVVLRGFLLPQERRSKTAADTIQLTSREREIVQLIAEGKTNKEAATRLGVSVKTVDAHRANIMAKLDLHSVADLVRYAIRNKIIEA